MKLLSAQGLLEIWEKGQNQHDLDRALTILEAACLKKKDELTELSIGERDRNLISLREGMFGHTLTGFSTCPNAGAPGNSSFNTRYFTYADNF